MKLIYTGSILLAAALSLHCGKKIDQEAANKHFKSGNATHRKALSLYDQRKFDQARPVFLEAIKDYEAAVKYFPKYGSVYLTIGDTYLKIKDYPKAAEAFKKTLTYVPDHDQAYGGLGFAYLQSRKHKESAEAYEKAIKLDPKVAENYYYCAFAYKMLKKDAKAKTYLEKAIKLQKVYAKIAESNPVLKELL